MLFTSTNFINEHTTLWFTATIESLSLALFASEVSFLVMKTKGYRNLIFLPFLY